MNGRKRRRIEVVVIKERKNVRKNTSKGEYKK